MRTTQSRQLTVSVKAATQRMAPAKAVKGAKAKSAAAPGFGGPDRTKWLPNVEAPEWLDGSLPGDAGFDPLGLGKPTEYYQFDLDALDQNLPKNRAGGLLGKLKPAPVEVKEDALVPYTEVFDINRFRECELIHGRWAMLATLGAVVAELNTGVSWLDAGKYELENGSSYASLPLPFDLTQLVIIQTILMAGIEVLRNKELDVEKRCYPGGAFDPLNLASEPGSEQTFRLRVAEIKHSRLAMVAFFGYAAAAPKNGSLLGALESVFNK